MNLGMFSKADPGFEAQLIKRPEEFVKDAGEVFMTQWTFKNSGKKMWPKGVQCHQIGYEDITFKFIKVKIESDSCQLVKNCPTPKSLGIDDYQVDLYDEMTIHMEITMPQQPGEVKLRFRL